MRRRDFITLIGVAAAAWPLTAQAQQSDRMRRIGVLMNTAADNVEGHAGVTAFQQVLQEFGWTEGRNVRIDVRWGENEADRDNRYAAELMGLAPDIFLGSGTVSVTALQRITRTLPIVFVQVSDPVGAGLVDTLARPGGNATGFMNFEYSLSSKWVELLKQVAPRVTRAAVLRNPANPAGVAQFGSIQTAAHSLGVEVNPVSVRDAGEIERSVATLARAANGGLIVTPSAGASGYIDLILTLAAKYKLPAVYSDRFNVSKGGLLSYGPDRIEQYRRAAGYVDRILKGENAADLPVQAPTKFELVINLKTAKTLGLTVSQTLQASADEVIE